MTDRFLKQLQEPPEPVAATLAAYQRKMEALLGEMARLAGWQSWAANRSLPVGLLVNFEKVLALYDESIRFSLGYLRRCGYNVSCSSGCSHCCSHMPCGVGAMELVYLYHGMREHRGFSRWVRRFLERAECWSELCLRHGLRPSDGPLPEPVAAELLAEYQGLQQDCPLLEQGLCLLYKYRPLACRMHFSLSRACWCDPGHFQHEYAVAFNLEPGERVYQVLARVDERFGLDCSDSLVNAMLELTVNVLHFQRIEWIS